MNKDREKEYQEMRKRESDEIKERQNAEAKQGTSFMLLLLGSAIFFIALLIEGHVGRIGGIAYLALLLYFLRQHDFI